MNYPTFTLNVDVQFSIAALLKEKMRERKKGQFNIL